MEEVAVKAGISKGNIYNYFRSKEDFFEQFFVTVVAALEADVLQILSGPLPASEKLKWLLDHRCESMEDSKRVGRLVLEFWATAAREQRGQLATTLRQMYARWREQVANVLTEGIAQGEFTSKFDPPLAAVLIMALLDGIEVQSILGFGATLDDQFRSTLKQAVIAALMADTKE